MKVVAFEKSLKELLVFSMRNGNEVIFNSMWGNEETRKSKKLIHVGLAGLE